jgi:hypothetical protein
MPPSELPLYGVFRDALTMAGERYSALDLQLAMAQRLRDQIGYASSGQRVIPIMTNGSLGISRDVSSFIEEPTTGTWITDGRRKRAEDASSRYVEWFWRYCPPAMWNALVTAAPGYVWAVRYDLVLVHITHESQALELHALREAAPNVMRGLIDAGFGKNLTNDMRWQERHAWYDALGRPRPIVEEGSSLIVQGHGPLRRGPFKLTNANAPNENAILGERPPVTPLPAPASRTLWFEDE